MLYATYRFAKLESTAQSSQSRVDQHSRVRLVGGDRDRDQDRHSMYRNIDKCNNFEIMTTRQCRTLTTRVGRTHLDHREHQEDTRTENKLDRRPVITRASRDSVNRISMTQSVGTVALKLAFPFDFTFRFGLKVEPDSHQNCRPMPGKTRNNFNKACGNAWDYFGCFTCTDSVMTLPG